MVNFFGEMVKKNIFVVKFFLTVFVNNFTNDNFVKTQNLYNICVKTNDLNILPILINAK